MPIKLTFIFVLLFPFLITDCSSDNSGNNISLSNDPHYPRWLADSENHTNQTSGISFIGTMENGEKLFILADDIGALHLLKISNDTIFTISEIKLGDKFLNYLKDFPKPDFESIAYDRKESAFYLSIEGNDPDPVKYTKILKLKFDNTSHPDSLISFSELHIQPEENFIKYIAANTAFEGLTADSKYLYLGLEGFVRNEVFADSTILFIVDKKSLKIIKEINTKSLSIWTINGLVSDKDLSVWGIDRNGKKIFHLTFNSELDIEQNKLYKVETHIPNYNSFDYVASLEGITIDNEDNFYLVDDPWWKYFIPDNKVLNQLDSLTIDHFRKYIPVIYKLISVNQ